MLHTVAYVFSYNMKIFWKYAKEMVPALLYLFLWILYEFLLLFLKQNII